MACNDNTMEVWQEKIEKKITELESQLQESRTDLVNVKSDLSQLQDLYKQECETTHRLNQELTELKEQFLTFEQSKVPRGDFESDWISESKRTNQSVEALVASITEDKSSDQETGGYVYDQQSGLYYDHSTGYYYDPVQQLYYDGNTRTYFYYRAETGTYEFHSQHEASPPHDEDTQDGTEAKKVKKKDKVSSEVATESVNKPDEQKPDDDGTPNPDNGSDTEEGECSTSSGTCSSDDEVVTIPGQTSVEHVSSPIHYTPCIRVVVKDTDNESLRVGDLYVITCTGAEIGRLKTKDICLPEKEVSKDHAKVQYNDEQQRYEVCDLGSQRGTFLNDTRLSEAKKESSWTALQHGDTLRFGTNTVLLLHIHVGSETCDQCEPGVIQAALKQQEKDVVVLSKAEKEKLRRAQLKRIKKKYCLQNSAYVDNIKKKLPSNYEDRAENRRKTKGIDLLYAKTESASVDMPIESGNKGFKLMQKMGWSAGEGLGKTQEGIKEPVLTVSNSARRGLGSTNSAPVELDKKTKIKSMVWKKTQKRYAAISTDQEKQ